MTWGAGNSTFPLSLINASAGFGVAGHSMGGQATALACRQRRRTYTKTGGVATQRVQSFIFDSRASLAQLCLLCWGHGSPWPSAMYRLLVQDCSLCPGDRVLELVRECLQQLHQGSRHAPCLHSHAPRAHGAVPGVHRQSAGAPRLLTEKQKRWDHWHDLLPRVAAIEHQQCHCQSNDVVASELKPLWLLVSAQPRHGRYHGLAFHVATILRRGWAPGDDPAPWLR